MLLCYQSWQIGCVIATTIKRTAPLEGLSVYHFRGGVSRLQFGSLGTQRPENGGGIQGGETSPLGTRLLERSGKSLVCYTFCPGWRGKGAARSGAVTFPHQEIRQWDGAAAIIPLPDFGRDKRYIQPPSRRSDIANGPIIGPASHPSGREVKPLTGRLYHLPWADFQRAKPAHAGALPASPDQFHRPPYVKWHR